MCFTSGSTSRDEQRYKYQFNKRNWISKVCDSNNLDTIASLNITDLTDSKNANDIFSCSNDILKKTVTVSRIYTNTFFK